MGRTPGKGQTEKTSATSAAPRILHTPEGDGGAWTQGFTHLLIEPWGAADGVVREAGEPDAIVAQAKRTGLPFVADLPWYAHADSSSLLRQRHDLFEAAGDEPAADPRAPDDRASRRLAARRTELRSEIAAWIVARAAKLAEMGADGVRLAHLDAGDASFWSEVVTGLRNAAPNLLIIGDGVGGPFEAVAEAESAGFDYLVDSAAWWDGRADWFLDQRSALNTPTLGLPEALGHDDLTARIGGDLGDAAIARTARTLLTSTGLIVSVRLIERAGDRFAAALPNLLGVREAAGWMDAKGPLAVTAKGLLRTDADPRFAERGLGLTAGDAADLLLGAGGHLVAVEPVDLGRETLVAFARRDARHDGPVPKPASDEACQQLASVRVAIEDAYPVIDAGRFAAKRIVGDTLVVGADVFADGHDKVAADVVLTEFGQPERRLPMQAGLNDRWSAQTVLTAMGRSSFRIEGWRDDFASWVSEVTKKRAAGVDVSLEAIEGREIAMRSLDVAVQADLSDDEARLARTTLDRVKDADGDTDALVGVLTDEGLSTLLRKHGERPFACRTPDYPLTVDRRQARFSSWYELFPRSQSGDMDRHGTFDDVIARLPYVKDLGFDVLYFPPIHPIGTTNRKGKNNSLKAEPGDVGSPYAIGSSEGGYKSIHPELGTIEDFDRLVARAADHGLEIALDIALNCSPDHPWIEKHPEWFEHRPDGTIKFAENPPKKYEDIVNLSYYGEAIPGLWQELRDTFLYWCEHGVRMYRIDNPHTKPYPLWEWLIAEVKAAYPDALFLSEAFTRPKVMARLAKLGFTQSYTYFTWRNTKAEMEQYVRELNTAPLRDIMNPNFFMNTPDINPIPLQTNNRAAHIARMVLASSLSASWGLYNGIEIVESTVLPGKEEYLDSEKYQIRVWDMDRPGHIKDDIRLMNRLRARHPAIQEHGTVRILQAWNDQVMWYAKRTPDLTDYLLFAVTFDYDREQRAGIELPLWEFGLPDDAQIAARDLVSGNDFTWSGKHQDITLGPDRPYAAFQLFGPAKQDASPLYADPKAQS